METEVNNSLSGRNPLQYLLVDFKFARFETGR